jgi:hypothetical protein
VKTRTRKQRTPALPETATPPAGRPADKSDIAWKLERLRRQYKQGGNFTLLFEALPMCEDLNQCPGWVARELFKLGRGWFVPPRELPKRKGRARGSWRQEHWENLKHVARAGFFEEALIAGYPRLEAKRLAAEYFKGTRAAGAGETMLASYRIVTRGRARNPGAWGVLSRFDEEYIAREFEPAKQQRHAFFAALPTNRMPPAKPRNPTPAASCAYEREHLRGRRWAEKQDARRYARLGQMFSEIARAG